MKTKPTIHIIVDVPIATKEAVTLNEDGSYTVFLRPDLMGEQQRQAMEHAIYHIEHDFGPVRDDVQHVERVAHFYG